MEAASIAAWPRQARPEPPLLRALGPWDPSALVLPRWPAAGSTKASGRPVGLLRSPNPISCAWESRWDLRCRQVA